MRLDSLERHFESIGARVKFGKVELPGWMRAEPKTPREQRARERARRRLPRFTIDISEDRKGEFFEICTGRTFPRFEILQSLPKERHLLMLVSGRRRFLCGHDERHWFTAEVGRPVSTVRNARRALLPTFMQMAVRNVSPDVLALRKNWIFVRQGEWFFIPTDLLMMKVDETVIHRNEPIRRSSRSKPHVCEELVRERGETVYELDGITYTGAELAILTAGQRRRARTVRRNSFTFARGYVRHPDHSTITLEGWHLVRLNDERSTSNLAFLD